MPSSDKLFEWKVENCIEDYSVDDGVLPRDEVDVRKSLPVHSKHKSIKLTNVIKHLVGKDLTRVSLPLSVNEPLSMLQRLAEGLEYVYLLAKADIAEDPVLRMELVTAFCVACLSTSKDRTLKPFNPLLGETYQLEKYGVKLLAEQVKHHPPISALYADGEHFSVTINIAPEVFFWGMSLEVSSKGHSVIYLKKPNEYYFWPGVPLHIRNLILGTPYLEYVGSLTIRKKSSHMIANVEFSGKSKSGLDGTAVKGVILDKYIEQSITTFHSS